MNRFNIGDSFETTVVAVTDTTVFVNLSAKSEGVIDISEFKDDQGDVSVKEGDKIKVFFTGELHGEMRFTTKIGGSAADDTMLENAWKGGIPVEGHVEAEIKGGYEIKLGGKRAFCPYSQMGFKDKKEPAAYVGRTMSFIITEYKNEGRDILVSNRKIGESEYAASLGKLATQITEGAVVDAVVESIEKFGAFVNIMGFRALLPISEMSLDRVQNAGDIVEVGQELKVKVIHTDWKNERVSVSLKALMANPWEGAGARFPVGSKQTGKISRIAEFGVFVNIAPGIDGLVHISDLEDVSANTNLRKVYKVGQEMSVVVEKINAAEKRLSLKPASSAEQDSAAAKYMSSQDDDGETYNPFAALLKK